MSCFLYINCYFLLQIWVCASARCPVLPWGPKLNCLTPGLDAPVLYKLSFEGEIGMEANDLVNCIPERGHNWIIKCFILFYLLSDARLQCQQPW